MKRAVVCLLAAVLASAAAEGGQEDFSAYLRGLPIDPPAIAPPVFPDRVVTIVEHGAVGDGVTMNTEAFARAIDRCAKDGGGTVLVPRGLWLTGPIRLKSNINLHVAEGAVVLFSRRFEDHPIIAGFDGTARRYRCVPLVSAYREENVAITGTGMFDGQGDAWRPVKKDKMTASDWKRLVASGGAVGPDGKIWYPSEGAMQGEELLKTLDARKGSTKEEFAKAREFLRPVLAQLVECRNILVDGPSFVNSPSFHLQPVQSENILIRNVTVRTEWWAQNGDGIDLSSCRDVLVARCVVDAGDDALCIKPGTIARGQKPGPACERIVIADCKVYHGHGGFVIGSESYGGARNIAVRNCTFQGTDVGLRFKSARGRGGVIENIVVESVVMSGIAREAILFDMFYDASPGVASGGDPGRGGRIPEFRKFTFRDISCSGAAQAILIRGLEEMPVKDLLFENVTLQAARGMACTDLEGGVMKHVRIIPDAGPMAVLERVRDVEIDLGGMTEAVDTLLAVGGKSSGIRLRGLGSGMRKGAVVLGPGVAPDAVTIDERSRN